MKVHYFQHVPFEGLGCIADWLSKNDFEVTATRFYEEDAVIPAIETIDVLIVMGGPMGVYDERSYPWLSKEKIFIERAIHSGKKVLGICLGAQLIAHCLGATISRANHKEIGWYPLIPAMDSKMRPGLMKLFENNPAVFHWHGDKFEIPDAAYHLLDSAGNTNQAFAYRNNVLALQFHLEVTADDVHQMILNGGEELVAGKFVQTADEITESAADYAKASNAVMEGVLDLFLKSI